MAECMASDGLREVVLDLRSRLNTPSCFLSSAVKIKLTGTNNVSALHPEIYSNISEWYGERVFPVKWLITGSGCPFQIGSSVTILYDHPVAGQTKLMALADSSGKIHFVSAKFGQMAHMSRTVMDELNENDVKLKWFHSSKTLQLITKADTRVDFVQIEPVVLIR
jgi:hypothetical protein